MVHEMRVELHKNALKFIELLDENKKEKIRIKIKQLVNLISIYVYIPFKKFWN